jgi:hypothetical protein
MFNCPLCEVDLEAITRVTASVELTANGDLYKILSLTGYCDHVERYTKLGAYPHVFKKAVAESLNRAGGKK